MLRRRLLAAPVVVTLLAAAACVPGPGGGHGAVGSDQAPPPLSEVTPLDDPRGWEGPVHAGLGGVEIRPVTDDAAPQLPVTLTDAQGTEVTVTEVDRILALDIYGTLSQTVFELGLGESLVGRDVSTQFDEARDLPLVTSNGHELNAESILALDPTLIITDTSLGPWDVVLQMRDAGIPVVVVDSTRSLENIATITSQVAAALGVPDLGVKLSDRIMAETQAVIDEIAAVAPSPPAEQLRTVFLYVRGQAGVYYMFGEGSGADDLIASLGLYDVTAEIGWSGMKPVNDEGVIAAQPELIIMMTKGLDSVDGVDGLLDRLPALANTPAGQSRRIVDMDDSQVLSFGPRTPDVLNSLAVSIYAPEALT
ncbi:ABC transporter substrate-binding protein [Aeromicrobium sp.]|uniref:heme/hemin ABC transporter substrate-binding protein n=1 Tax=Aeromicrobium sp. TaxID=1871063 RepID=UPI0025C576A9|nr:ABC transporter substrate-binding protein [Aeromicrobium sp.]MCK5891917.1 ABC transporter substrate-binding protein [Aeromicrobium sp.]